MGPEREPLVTLEEVARYLGKTPASVYQMRHRGEFVRGYRLGRRVMFRLSEVDQWVAAQAEPEPRPA
jgi:excisionase family DNA binding protein